MKVESHSTHSGESQHALWSITVVTDVESQCGQTWRISECMHDVRQRVTMGTDVQRQYGENVFGVC